MRRLGRLCGPCGKPARDLDSVKLTSPSQVTLAVRRDDVLAGRARPSKPGAAPAAPAAPEVALPDFSGRWVLTGSRNFDEYLSAMGVNYVKRKLAAGMKPLQEWTLVDGSWQFSVSTPVGIRVESFPLGVHVPDEVDGVAMVKRSMWDGAVLHTSVVPNDPNMSAQLGSMTMRRYLLGAGVEAKLMLEMKVGNVVAFREFSRAGPAPAARPGRVGRPALTTAVLADPAPVRSPAGDREARVALDVAPPTVALPDFSGRWVLTGSRNFDEYLSAMGVNYVKRKLAAGMKPLQEWTLVDGSWQFSVSTPVGIRVESFPLGVELADEVDGEAMAKMSSWDGPVLHTAVVPLDPRMAAKCGEMSMRRYLLGAGVEAKLMLEMKVGNVVAFREFSRAK